MSTSCFISGIVPADERYNKMLEIHNLCKQMGVDTPKEVLNFFDHIDEPDEAGYNLDLTGKCEEWRDRWYNGYELKVSDIPENVKVLRFYWG